MYSRAELLTPEDAKRYKIRSVSGFLRKPGIFFATMKGFGLPLITVKLEYRVGRYDTSVIYTVSEVRDEHQKVPHVDLHVQDILEGKVKSLLEKFHAVDIKELEREKARETCL
jgi:hypothetical protein